MMNKLKTNHLSQNLFKKTAVNGSFTDFNVK